MARKKKKKKKKRRVKIVAVLVILVVGVGFWRFRVGGRKSEDVVKPVSLKKGAVIDRLTETGKVEYARIVEVKSAISGRVNELRVDDGQHVERGDVMAVIEPDPDQALRLSEKAVSVRRFRILLSQAEKEHDRQNKLYAKELVSKEQWEDAQYARDLARHSYELAKMELKILQEDVQSVASNPDEENPGGTEEGSSNDGSEADPADLESEPAEILLMDFNVQAPLAGMVLERRVEEGDMVIRGTSSFTVGHTLFRIGDPKKIIVSSMINEIDVAKLSVDTPVKIVPNADEQRTYRGKIEKISPQGIKFNEIVYFRVEVWVLEPDSFLRQEMSCDVDVVLGEREDCHYLPVEAVLKVYKKDKEGKETKQIDKYIVFKKTGKKYEEAEVEVGLKSETRMEILSGLTPEDKVHPDAEKMAKKRKKGEKKAEPPADKGTG